jgi:hypothetical protein
LLFLAVCCLQAGRASIVIAGFTAATNDRFANSSAFVLDAYSLSGVGLTASGQWGTLISPNVVVSAWHYNPGSNGTLTFYGSNDPNGGSLLRTVVDSQRIGTSDLWIGALDTPLPDGYTPFPYTTTLITDNDMFLASGYAGATVYMMGRSQTNTGYGASASTDTAVGVNLLDTAGTVTVSGTTDYAIGAVQNVLGDTNYQTYEAYLQGGDSGGPLFTITGGALELLGINWFIGTADIDPGPGETLRNVSGFSFVGNYAETLQAFIDAHPVPEPSTLILLAMLPVLLAASRRR